MNLHTTALQKIERPPFQVASRRFIKSNARTPKCLHPK
jgi:hypothetical protein